MKLEDFGPFTLSEEAHDSPAEGMCVMEMVSFLAGEKWSDMPKCSSPVVARFCQGINDLFDQDVRDRLQTYVPRLIGTASPEHDLERAEYLAWQAIKVFAPEALDAAGLSGHADKLRGFAASLGLYDAARASYDASAAALAFPAGAAARAAAGAARTAANAGLDTLHDDCLGAAYDAVCAAEHAGDTDLVFSCLDGLLEIGPSGTAYTQEHLDRLPALKEAVTA